MSEKKNYLWAHDDECKDSARRVGVWCQKKIKLIISNF